MRRWVFSLYPSPTLLRLSPFCRGPPAHPATSRVLRSRRLHPALLRASRSRFPSVRQFGTEPQPRPEPEPRPNAARCRSRPPRPVRRSSRLRPAAGLYYKRSFIARHPSQPDNDMRSALAALRSRTRAFLPPSPPRLEPGTKKRPHVAVRASVSPKIGRITSRSSRRSP